MNEEEIDLDVYGPDMQFVSNESLVRSINDGNFSIYRLEMAPVIEGSIAGTIYHNGVAIQTFYGHNPLRNFRIDLISSDPIRVTNITVNYRTGEMLFLWNSLPGRHHCVISYEFSNESNSIQEGHTKINWIKDGF
jgi:hypothetical protein